MINFYIGYNFIEEEQSANQIQTRNTFFGLEKIDPNIIGIFLGNKNKLFWNVRQNKNRYFIDRNDILNYIPEKIFNISLIRKNLFPYFFAYRCKIILEKYKEPKNIYIRQGEIDEFLFFLNRININRLNIKRIIFELHNLNFDIPNFYHWNFEKKYSYKKYIKFFNLLEYNSQKVKLVTLTNKLANIIEERFNYKNNIEIIPDAHNFYVDKPKHINFNKEKIEIIYTGLNWKLRGVEEIIKAIKFLPDNFYVRLIGGRPEERKKFKEKYHFYINKNKLILEKSIAQKKIKNKLMKADIAVLPTPEEKFNNYTSPLKLFEYMSVGIPIIASNIPIFREILSKKSAVFFWPKDSKDLSKKIILLVKNKKLAQQIGENAFNDSHKYTYDKRAEMIYKLFLHNGKNN